MAETSSHNSIPKASPVEEAPYDEQESDIQIAKPLKPFTMWSALSLGFNITNTGISIIMVVGNAFLGAGPMFFYSTLLIAAVSFCVAITLGEFVSAYPHAGGQYIWVYSLSPERPRRFLSYMTAIISWASVICTGASAAQAASTIVFQLVIITRPNFRYQRWMGFLAMQAFNILAASLTIYERLLPKVYKTLTIFSMTLTLAIFICLLAAPTQKQSAAVVFGREEWFNTSGWSDGVAFLIGMSGVNWGFSCLDAATHLAEELPDPRKNIPTALLYTVGIGLVVAMMINLAIFFAVTELDKVTSIIAIFYSVYENNPTCAYVLGSLLILSVTGALAGIHSWQSRIAWSLSRDRGSPFHYYMSQLAPAPFHSPLWATLWGICWIGLCGFLYLASTTAFNSFVGAGICLQYLTYATPAALLLIRGRKQFPHGPYHWPKFGPVANVVVILWTLLTLVMYSFPLFLPVQSDSMNYLSVMIVFAFLYAGAYWVFYGNKHYRLVDLRLIID